MLTVVMPAVVPSSFFNVIEIAFVVPLGLTITTPKFRLAAFRTLTNKAAPVVTPNGTTLAWLCTTAFWTVPNVSVVNGTGVFGSGVITTYPVISPSPSTSWMRCGRADGEGEPGGRIMKLKNVAPVRSVYEVLIWSPLDPGAASAGTVTSSDSEVTVRAGAIVA